MIFIHVTSQYVHITLWDRKKYGYKLTEVNNVLW